MDLNIEGFDQKAEAIINKLKPEQDKESRVQDAWSYIPEVKDLACHPEVIKWLEILYRRRPIPFQTLNFKMGTQQATHSDLVHFNSFPERFMAGVWMALEDTDENNGALHYYPKSHKLPVFELHDIGIKASSFKMQNEQYKQYEHFVQKLMKDSGLEKKTVPMKKGQVLIWAANLFHGGDPIKDLSRTRHSQVTHFYFDNCRYYTPLYSDVYLETIWWKEFVDIRTGKLVPHKYLGQKVGLPLKQRLRYFVERSLRHNKTGQNIVKKLKKLLTSR